MSMQTFFFSFADDLSHQEDIDPPKEYDPGQFAGLLHGSSPACESPENPFHLYGKRDEREEEKDEVSLANSPLPFKQTPIENKSEPVVKKIKPKVVSRTIFHKKSSQLENHTIVGTRTARSGSRNGDQWIVNTGGFVERACTLGRIRSLPKALIDMHLSKTVSKSDSDLIAYPSNEKTSRVNWSESSPADHSSKGNSERTPSFTSEWEEIDKIMNSIDVGINSELREINGENTRPRCPVQTVGQWLESIGLPQYENHLMANGFDNVQFMQHGQGSDLSSDIPVGSSVQGYAQFPVLFHRASLLKQGSNVMEDQDLLEIGILNSGHRQRILQAIQLLPKMRPIGHDGYHPTSVAEWLDSIELGDYTKAFLINGYTSMDLLKKIWEVELINSVQLALHKPSEQTRHDLWASDFFRHLCIRSPFPSAMLLDSITNGKASIGTFKWMAAKYTPEALFQRSRLSVHKTYGHYLPHPIILFTLNNLHGRPRSETQEGNNAVGSLSFAV
ncbi:hypothetical protein E5288_WYG005890 [Bos mutus]|uniref:SAM domain-containing protein n=1 Tax=Bos mutus TaxID=72004 RepID=A0A6B0QWP2_9CETA|nr:hypothetical protein [Bos mutus]